MRRRKYSIVPITNALIKSYLGVLILGSLCLNACKEDCVGCNVECKSFFGHVPIYCLSDFNNDRVAYDTFVDSLEQIYPSQDVTDRIGFCEDETRAVELESRGWQCIRYKD